MDSNSIAILEDYKSAIDTSFMKMEKSAKNFEESDQSKQNIILNTLNTDLNSCKTNIGLMKMEVSNLKEEGNINKWQEIISHLQANHENYSKLILQMKNKINKVVDDPLSIDVRADLSKITSQQVMDRGDNIIRADSEAIDRMKKVFNQDLDTIKEFNKELFNQGEKIDNAEKNKIILI